jgi:predicted RNase H-like HicB family nuclease
MAEYGFTVIYVPLEDAGYQVIVPALPEIVTYGRTLLEAKEMAGDAIACHLRGLIKDNEEIPKRSLRIRSACEGRTQDRHLRRFPDLGASDRGRLSAPCSREATTCTNRQARTSR